MSSDPSSWCDIPSIHAKKVDATARVKAVVIDIAIRDKFDDNPQNNMPYIVSDTIYSTPYEAVKECLEEIIPKEFNPVIAKKPSDTPDAYMVYVRVVIPKYDPSKTAVAAETKAETADV